MVQSTESVPSYLAACVEGDPEARRTFQAELGPDIYNFPVKIYRLPAEDAADFYVYAFEQDRIWKRLRTFEGRNNIQFRTFLSYYVLKAIFLEWQRTRKELLTVSLSDPVRGDGESRTLEDVLPNASTEEADDAPVFEGASELLASLSPEDRLDLKLLSLIEHDLEPDEVRLLAKISRRPVGETLDLLAEVQAGLRSKDARASQLRDELDSVWGWLLLRRRELQEIQQKLRLLGSEERKRGELEARRAELEAAVTKRSAQRERVLEEIRKYKVTTPYKDIARLLGLTVGTVCSRIFRLRQRLTATLEGEGAPPQEEMP